MLQVSSYPLAVLLIFPSEGPSAELLLLLYLQVEHDDGEECKCHMKDIGECQQQGIPTMTPEEVARLKGLTDEE